MNEILAALIGFVAGAVGGLMGVGGGILFVPALTILLDKTQIQAEATSLLAIIPVALAGSWRQYKYGNLRIADALAVGLLSPVGVVAGVVVANELPQRALELSFAALLLFVAAQMVRRALRSEDREPARGRP
ncbi:MAG: TSUP family transporter [Solirubrobacterales bacterium]